jgi:hypothetical protein
VRGYLLSFLLRLEPAGLRVIGAGQREIRQLKAGKWEAATWTLCGATSGSYVILAQATVDGSTIESAARVVTVIAGGRKS